MLKNLENSWYQRRPSWRWAPLTVPLTGLYAGVSALRRMAYQRQWLAAEDASVPVLVVGNISIGGTGKTPFTLWLVQQLVAQGYRPGIVSRGYGGKRSEDMLRVTADTSVQQVGDEPAMLFQRLQCPVMVGSDRPAVIRALLADSDCNVIVTDDGLQHYRMSRDIEFAVVDGRRGLGNAYLLPLGPLREPRHRLQTVDVVVSNGHPEHASLAGLAPAVMQLEPQLAVNLLTQERRDLQAFTEVVAMAGIGHPQRFFNTLSGLGLAVTPQAMPDHHAYCAEDIPQHMSVLMTEKDAVKCAPLVQQLQLTDCWYVPVEAVLTESDAKRIMQPIILSLASHSAKP